MIVEPSAASITRSSGRILIFGTKSPTISLASTCAPPGRIYTRTILLPYTDLRPQIVRKDAYERDPNGHDRGDGDRDDAGDGGPALAEADVLDAGHGGDR